MALPKKQTSEVYEIEAIDQVLRVEPHTLGNVVLLPDIWLLGSIHLTMKAAPCHGRSSRGR